MSEPAVIRSTERLSHFRCAACQRWWTIGDAPEHRPEGWFCPWCGTHHTGEREADPLIPSPAAATCS